MLYRYTNDSDGLEKEIVVNSEDTTLIANAIIADGNLLRAGSLVVLNRNVFAKEPRFFVSSEENGDPRGIDYRKQEFVRVKTFVLGDLTEVRYYTDAGKTTIAVKETITTTDNADSVPISKSTLIEWYLDDGTVGISKTIGREFSATEMMEALGKRIENRISYAKVLAMQTLTGTINSVPEYRDILDQVEVATLNDVSLLLLANDPTSPMVAQFANKDAKIMSEYRAGARNAVIEWVRWVNLPYLTPALRAQFISQL